jgi:NTE family protein
MQLDVSRPGKTVCRVGEPPRQRRGRTSSRADAAFGDSVRRPYLHLVDGGVADNVGMRAVLDAMEILESLHDIGAPTPLDSTRRVVVFMVNSQSSPPTNWDEFEASPGTLDILLKAAGTPIDSFSYESIELLNDTAARWRTMRRIRDSAR